VYNDISGVCVQKQSLKAGAEALCMLISVVGYAMVDSIAQLAAGLQPVGNGAGGSKKRSGAALDLQALQAAPDAKRRRIVDVSMPWDKLLELFPVDSSEVVVRCDKRQAGGAGKGNSSFNLRAGEDKLEIVVTIKTSFGLVDPVLAQSLMHGIVLQSLPAKVFVRQSGPRFSSATGEVIFSVCIEKSGEIEISAAITMPSLTHLPQNLEQTQRGGTIAHTIGGRAGVIRVKVQPGAMQFQNLIATKEDVLVEKVEFERGERIRLVWQLGTSDQFGNSFSDRDLKAFAIDLRLEGHWTHCGTRVDLRLSQPPTCTEAGILVGMMDLQVLGEHNFRIKCSSLQARFSSQDFATTLQVVPGIPHLLQLIGEGQPQTLGQRRWECKAKLLNKHGYSAIADVSKISVDLVPVVPSSDGGGASNTKNLAFEKVKLLERPDSVKGCSLADADATLLQELEIFYLEPNNPTCKGDYHLKVKVGGQSVACQPNIIHLDFPLDPKSWSSQDLAKSIQLGGWEVAGDVLKDKFGAVVNGKDLVESRDPVKLLEKCLLHNKKFANQEEEEDAETRSKQFADGLMEKHQLANLSKGNFQKSVAKCMNESNLRCARPARSCVYVPRCLSIFSSVSLSFCLVCLSVCLFIFVCLPV